MEALENNLTTEELREVEFWLEHLNKAMLANNLITEEEYSLISSQIRSGKI